MWGSERLLPYRRRHVEHRVLYLGSGHRQSLCIYLSLLQGSTDSKEQGLWRCNIDGQSFPKLDHRGRQINLFVRLYLRDRTQHVRWTPGVKMSLSQLDQGAYIVGQAVDTSRGSIGQINTEVTFLFALSEHMVDISGK